MAEDEPINQMILADNLAEDGATVVMVGNGQGGARPYRRGWRCEAYDIVLMDFADARPWTATRPRVILALAPDLLIVAQTAHALEEEREKCLGAGMVGHIAKPIDPDELVLVVVNMHVQKSNVRSSGARSSGNTGVDCQVRR